MTRTKNNSSTRPVGGKPTKISTQKKQHIAQDDLEYADDTQLFMGNATRGQMCERLGNCDIATESRHLEIQWVKVELLRREKRKISRPLPPPFGKLKQSNTGTILGKEINTTGSLQKAVTKRLA